MPYKSVCDVNLGIDPRPFYFDHEANDACILSLLASRFVNIKIKNKVSMIFEKMQGYIFQNKILSIGVL